MDLAAKIFLGVYFSILFCLSLFGWHRYYMTYLFYRHRRVRPRKIPRFEDLTKVPKVTVQLPVYNEKYVVERLLRAVTALDYPREALEIQLLDDSNDETQQIAERAVGMYRRQGLNIHYLHRKNRQGFKAGALRDGLKVAKGDYVAIFDADFLPRPDFLKKVIPYFFGSEKYGMVQARWSHLNQDYSLMTQAQSVLLDGHFMMEHTARNRSGRFFNFNGTAGIWLKECIEDAGGWECDTLTEDLDLSYRAQMKGWKFLYLPHVVVPAELPVEMNGFKSQQYRWSKGSVQTALKLIPQLIKSSLPFRVKAEACFHLLGNFAYSLMFILALMMPLSLLIRNHYGLGYSVFVDLPVFILATLSIGTFYACSQKEIYPDWKTRLFYLPLNLTMGIGMCVNNTKAVLEALCGKQTPFLRTAKYSISRRGETWAHKNYRNGVNLWTWLEIALGLYFTVAVVFAMFQGMWLTLYCLMLFQVGFLYIGLLSLFQGRRLLGWMPRWETSSASAD